MTFPEWIAEHATWWDRLKCLLFGHRVRPYVWHPTDEAEDRRNWVNHCSRCGQVNPARCGCPGCAP